MPKEKVWKGLHYLILSNQKVLMCSFLTLSMAARGRWTSYSLAFISFANIASANLARQRPYTQRRIGELHSSHARVSLKWVENWSNPNCNNNVMASTFISTSKWMALCLLFTHKLECVWTEWDAHRTLRSSSHSLSFFQAVRLTQDMVTYLALKGHSGRNGCHCTGFVPCLYFFYLFEPAPSDIGKIMWKNRNQLATAVSDFLSLARCQCPTSIVVEAFPFQLYNSLIPTVAFAPP